MYKIVEVAAPFIDILPHAFDNARVWRILSILLASTLNHLIVTKFAPLAIIRTFHPFVVEIDDVWVRTIILIHLDFFTLASEKTWEFVSKTQNIFDSRTTETVKGLVIIANHANAIIGSRHFQENLFLNSIRILILINHDVMDFLLNILEHLLIIKEFPHFSLNQRKIQRILFKQNFSIY